MYALFPLPHDQTRTPIIIQRGMKFCPLQRIIVSIALSTLLKGIRSAVSDYNRVVALSQVLICSKSISVGVRPHNSQDLGSEDFFIRTVIKCALKEGIVSEILEFFL